MNDSLRQRTSPREETLDFLRAFARFYQPEPLTGTTEPRGFFNNQPPARC